MTQPLEDIGERRALLTSIIQSMPPDTGNVPWKEYFDSHPKDAALLGYKSGVKSSENPVWNRNNVMANAMVRTGQVKPGKIGMGRIPLIPYTVKAKDLVLTAHDGSNGNHRKTKRISYNEADYQLAAAIARQYPKTNIAGKTTVDWGRAFAEHPEWLAQLKGRRSMKGVTAFLARVRAKIARGELSTTDPQSVDLGPETTLISTGTRTPDQPQTYTEEQMDVARNAVRKLTAELERIKASAMPACPRCGLNIGMFQQAYEVALKHSR